MSALQDTEILPLVFLPTSVYAKAPKGRDAAFQEDHDDREDEQPPTAAMTYEAWASIVQETWDRYQGLLTKGGAAALNAVEDALDRRLDALSATVDAYSDVIAYHSDRVGSAAPEASGEPQAAARHVAQTLDPQSPGFRGLLDPSESDSLVERMSQQPMPGPDHPMPVRARHYMLSRTATYKRAFWVRALRRAQFLKSVLANVSWRYLLHGSVEAYVDLPDAYHATFLTTKASYEVHVTVRAAAKLVASGDYPTRIGAFTQRVADDLPMIETAEAVRKRLIAKGYYKSAGRDGHREERKKNFEAMIEELRSVAVREGFEASPPPDSA